MVMRNGKRVTASNVTFTLDTKSDPVWFVLRNSGGVALARQCRKTWGKLFRQGTNPDYTGYDAYVLQTWDPRTESWKDYNSSAEKGALLNTLFLERLVASNGPW